MESNGQNGQGTNGATATKNISYIMNTKNWRGPLIFILIISILGVGMIGFQTYIDAPPMTGFKDATGAVVIDQNTIERGQEVFHKKALMEYGSFFGDGAQRGPDYTAEALHWITVYMNDYYITEIKFKTGKEVDLYEVKQINEKVKVELKENAFNKAENIVSLSVAQSYALQQLKKHYTDIFIDKNSGAGFPPKNYIANREDVSELNLDGVLT